MNRFKNAKYIVLAVLTLAGLFVLTKYSLLKWGSLRIESDSTITVKGTYTMQITNQIATYNIGLNSTNASKETAINEVKTKADNVIKALSEYGIPAQDIQTTNMSVYQKEEPYYADGIQKFKKTDWIANTSLTVTLRDITKVDEFSDKVYAADVSDLNGPYFALDYNSDSDTEIMKKAIENVEKKAKTLAHAMGKQLGEVITIKEDDLLGYPVTLQGKMMGGGGAGGLPSGSTSVTKTVSVTYKIY